MRLKALTVALILPLGSPSVADTTTGNDELFLEVYNDGVGRSYIRDLGVTQTDFMKDPACYSKTLADLSADTNLDGLKDTSGGLPATAIWAVMSFNQDSGSAGYGILTTIMDAATVVDPNNQANYYFVDGIFNDVFDISKIQAHFGNAGVNGGSKSFADGQDGYFLNTDTSPWGPDLDAMVGFDVNQPFSTGNAMDMYFLFPNVDDNSVEVGRNAQPLGTWTFDSAKLTLNFKVPDGTAPCSSVLPPEAPVIATLADDTGDSATDRLTNDSTPTLSGTADATTMQVRISLDGTQVAELSVTGGVWSYASPQLADGDYSFTAIAVDATQQASAASQPFVVTVDTTASLGIKAVAGDSIVNAAEAQAGFAIAGTSTGIEVGRVVGVSLNGKSYAATVQAGGGWSASIPAADAQALPATGTVQATASDAAGNPAEAGRTFGYDAEAGLAINVIAGDDIVDAAEAQAGFAIAGTSTGIEVGRVVGVSLNGKSYAATVQAGGGWSASIPAADAQALPATGTVQATASDAAGNPAGASRTLGHNTGAGLAINVIAGDDIVDAAEAQAGIVVAGTATGIEAGREVTLSLNGQSYTATVQADGSWSVSLTPADAGALPTAATAQVSGTNAVGNPASASRALAHFSTPYVRMLSPNGGETWRAGVGQTLAWAAGNMDAKTKLNAYFSKDGGGHWRLLKRGLGVGGRWVWKPTRKQATAMGLLAVCVPQSARILGRCDRSDNTFVIAR